MDFKGITNIYQKFETMCLEVEEAMYKDTVKYMENQAEKVGTTVKKFYSDVMEDLLPPSSVEPMKIVSGDTDIDKKPKPNKESLLIGYYDVHSFVPKSPGNLVQNKCSEPCGAVSKKVGAHRRPIGIKRISKNDRPSKVSSGTTSSSGDRRSKPASSDTSSSRVASDDIDVMPSSLDLHVSREHKAEVKGNACIPDTPIESHAIVSVESVRPNKDDSESVRPNKDDAESVRPNKDDAESVRPKKDDSESARPNKDDSDVRPNKDDSESVRPNKDVSESLRPNKDDPESVRPNKDDSDDSESVRPSKDDSESGRPNKDDSESVRPNKYDSESVRPNKDASNSNSTSTSLASDDNLSAESVRLKGDPELPTGTSSVNDISFSLSSSSTRSNACNPESENKKVMVCNEGTYMKVGSSNVRTTLNAAESLDKEIIMSTEEMLDMELIEKDEVGEMEKLNESCVIVDETELHSVPQGTSKHKSYKKKIGEALWLKSRSRRDKECVDSDRKGKERDVVIPVDGVKADCFESEWELL